ncbi:MmpS family transport accessory protein [Mycolicibacterium sp. 050158]|uniref:MmpS family transport accessory protein n=1 Tax=Mycolicibacterium sp. 050158 TaxID=3090602 RepID=UPI00299CE616|nr:MmpS family transport accessory protein [Mycolicibacterium sp. 050158]MDX1893338.1 MmpS family transport accessory protein [Mycolicibacterium sp. 050158]
MSGPNPPEPDSPKEPGRDASKTGETEIYSRAYSAPESEQFTSAPYVPPDSSLYDYDAYDAVADTDDATPPRWPWVVGVVAIVAAISLVVSVAVLVTRTDSENVATPATSTTSSVPPVQDEITTTTPPPPPPPPTTEEPPPPPPETVTVTQEPPPPAPSPTEAPPPPPPAETGPPPVTTTAPAGPRFITYTVTGTKAPLDRISVTYTDASGRQRTQQNVYIPWSLTVTPISMSEFGSVQASSLLRLSKLNCQITTSDGQTIASQQNNDWQTSC